MNVRHVVVTDAWLPICLRIYQLSQYTCSHDIWSDWWVSDLIHLMDYSKSLEKLLHGPYGCHLKIS